MPFRLMGVVVMTARGLLVDPGTYAGVYIVPRVDCDRVPCEILVRPHNPANYGNSFEVPCCGTWVGYHCMCPAENVLWDGLPCANPGERPGCCHCTCADYHQWFWLVAGWGHSDALLIPVDLVTSVTLALPGPPCLIAPPCTYPCTMPDPDTGAPIENPTYCDFSVTVWAVNISDYNCDGDAGTDRDIEDFFSCLAGNCCEHCAADYDLDGDPRTDADIGCFFRALGGGSC